MDEEKKLADALSEYQKRFYENIKGGTEQAAIDAKEIVKKARTFVSDSRLAYSLSRSLFEHVKHWPSWAEKPEFSNICVYPFSYVSGGNQRLERHTLLTVTFRYKEEEYSIRHIDQGLPSWSDDSNKLGKLEFFAKNDLVLGLDVIFDISKEFSDWRMSDVYALAPGNWMKELVEMAAYIDGTNKKKLDDSINQNAITKAANIKLPE